MNLDTRTFFAALVCTLALHGSALADETASTKPLQKAPHKSAADADDISAPPRGTPSKTGTAEGNSGKPGKVLWDYWYTVTLNKKIHYEYYNDKAETKEGRIIFQNHAWKQEEGFINEEQLGVFAKADEDLSPLFFNFHSTYRSVETTIDANVGEDKGQGRQMVVRVRKGQNELPLIKKMVPPKTFFSELFPVWLGSRISSFKVGSPHSFQSILEDNLEAEFMTVNGTVRVEQPDDIANKTHTTKINVDYHNSKSTWWVDADGAPYRIDMPTQNAVVQRVSKGDAQKFLGAGG